MYVYCNVYVLLYYRVLINYIQLQNIIWDKLTAQVHITDIYLINIASV